VWLSMGLLPPRFKGITYLFLFDFGLESGVCSVSRSNVDGHYTHFCAIIDRELGVWFRDLGYILSLNCSGCRSPETITAERMGMSSWLAS
jgi:hypothetical protein